MKIKNFFNWMCVLAVGFSAVACSDDDDAPVVDSEVSKVALPRHRMFILNEGKNEHNNAGIGFMLLITTWSQSMTYFICRTTCVSATPLRT